MSGVRVLAFLCLYHRSSALWLFPKFVENVFSKLIRFAYTFCLYSLASVVVCGEPVHVGRGAGGLFKWALC